MFFLCATYVHRLSPVLPAPPYTNTGLYNFDLVFHVLVPFRPPLVPVLLVSPVYPPFVLVLRLSPSIHNHPARVHSVIYTSYTLYTTYIHNVLNVQYMHILQCVGKCELLLLRPNLQNSYMSKMNLQSQCT